MDLTLPLRAVSPGVDADVLGVLAGTHAPLTGSKIAVLAGRSYAQVREVLRRLVGHGLVEAERHGQAISYNLNRDHVLAPALAGLTGAHAEVEQRIRHIVGLWTVRPDLLAVFGSFARRDGDADSDIDLLLVRPRDVASDDPVWEQQRHALATAIEGWTGNAAQVVTFGADELGSVVERDEPLVANLRDDAYVIVGDAVPWRSTLSRSDG